MPSQVRIISPKNSAQWDDLVRSVISAGKLRDEHTYGGITNNERADRVRRCIRTAAKKAGYASKVYWTECDAAGKCAFGADCAYHCNFALFDLQEGREYKAKMAQQRR